MSDYFNDQAAMLRRLCDQMHDPDRAGHDRLDREEKIEAELRRADEEEDRDIERWDGQS